MDQAFIADTIKEMQQKAYEVRESVEYIDSQLFVILILCYCNIMFLISQIKKVIFLTKIGRRSNFPSFGFYIDALLAAASGFMIKWIQKDIFSTVPDESDIIPHDQDNEYFTKLAIF